MGSPKVKAVNDSKESTMTPLRVEKAYEKHAWILLFAVGAVSFIYTVFQLATGPSAHQDLQPIAGMSWDELSSANPRVAGYIDFIYRGLYAHGALTFFVMAVSLKSYRRGEKWSWHTVWSFPVLVAVLIANHARFSAQTEPTSLYFLTVLLIASLLGLLLPYRKFFPKLSRS